MHNSLKIAFLGGIFPKEIEAEIYKKSINHIQNAANVFQWNILKGLDYYLKQPVTILNAMFIGAYPKLYKDAYISKSTFNHSNITAHVDFQLPFLNLPLFKHYSRTKSFKNYIKKYIVNNNYDVVVGYSMTISVVEGLLNAKRKNRNITTCLVVPDLPEFMNMTEQSGLIRKLKGLSNKVLYQKVKEIDSFVVLTSHMPKALGVENKPYVVVEGIADPQEITYGKGDREDIKKVVYTGALQEKYGIKVLVDSFVKLDSTDVQLLLYGSGDMVSYIKEFSQKDSRIYYGGIVPHKDIRKIQEEAYLLVNPRNSKEEYTKYSFPSKTMEYMDAGRPVLMYRLPGIPEEYDDYLLYVDSEQEDGLYYALNQVLSLPRDALNKLGLDGKAFVKANKNCERQCKKIVEMWMQIR